MSAYALIPARSGSKRVPGKNLRELRGHPLLAYAIGAAQQSEIFENRIFCSSNDGRTLTTAWSYGAQVICCDLAIAHKDADPDIRWVRHAIDTLHLTDDDQIAILRPTSPFRPGSWITQAYNEFMANPHATSLRAMCQVHQHPGKMWVGFRSTGDHPFSVSPLLPWSGPVAPWHSMPTQLLPTIYVQTAALEIAHVKAILSTDSISGPHIMPWVCHPDSPVSFDINTEQDLLLAHQLATYMPGILPQVREVTEAEIQAALDEEDQ